MSRFVSLLCTAGIAGGLLLLTGCSASFRSSERPAGFVFRGLGASAYAVGGPEVIGELEGSPIHAGIFGATKRSGEIASIDIWPFLGVGVGIAGARVQILPIEIGVGTLAYKPRPPEPRDEDDDDDDLPEPIPPSVDDDDDGDDDDDDLDPLDELDPLG